MAPHSSTLAQKIPWMEERGGLQSMGVAKSQTRLSNFTFTFHFHELEEEMATHSSVLAWRIPGTGEPGGLPSMGSHRVTQLKRLSSSSKLYYSPVYPPQPGSAVVKISDYFISVYFQHSTICPRHYWCSYDRKTTKMPTHEAGLKSGTAAQRLNRTWNCQGTVDQNHPPWPSPLAQAVSQKEVPIRHMVLRPKTNWENSGVAKRGRRLPVSQSPSPWNPPWLRDSCATRKDPESDYGVSKMIIQTTWKLTP